MENKNKCVNAGFSTILWAFMAILLCSAPCTLAVVYIIDAEETGPIFLYSEDTLELLPGGFITNGLYAYSGSIVNITGGGVASFINVSEGATLTITGTNFAVTNGTIDASGSYFTIDDIYSPSVLTGTYGAGGGDIDLTFYIDSGVQIYLKAPGGEPLEAQLWVFPSLINRYGPLSKIWAIVRLPEGITKDEIDSEPLMLNPGGIEAACQYAFQWYEEGTLRTTIIASFDKANLMAAVPDGDVELEVVGGLNTDQEEFYGIDTVRIVSWPW